MLGVFRDRVIAGELSGKCFPRDLQAVRHIERAVGFKFSTNLLTTALLIFSVNSALPLTGFVARLSSNVASLKVYVRGKQASLRCAL